jgi:hypothetical protein
MVIRGKWGCGSRIKRGITSDKEYQCRTVPMIDVLQSLQASAMTMGSRHLIGRAPTLAMALVRHCTNPFVPLSMWESPVFMFEHNEKFSPWLTHYSLAIISLRTGLGKLGEPKAELTGTFCGFYLY